MHRYSIIEFPKKKEPSVYIVRRNKDRMTLFETLVLDEALKKMAQLEDGETFNNKIYPARAMQKRKK